MLISLGQGPKPPADLVGLLAECHERIRKFTGFARALAERDDVPEAEVLDICHRVERYFTEALPLHIRDEEESLAPRLRGLSREVDEALASMQEQHHEHESLLLALLEALTSLRDAPKSANRRERLGVAALAIEGAFGEHLALEESVLFPAIRESLSAEAQAEITAELRARRQP